MALQYRFNLKTAKGRTTVTLDTTTAELLAVHLGADYLPKSYDPLIQDWLQETITERLGENPMQVSQYARRYAVQAIAQPALVERVLDLSA